MRKSCLVLIIFFHFFGSSVQAEEIRVTKLSVQDSIANQFLKSGFELHGVLLIENLAGNEIPFSEISALEWDDDEEVLLALSDNGKLFHIRPNFQQGHLHNIELTKSFRLKDHHNRVLINRMIDSEGLALHKHRNGVKSDSELFISFEREPRVIQYESNGKFLKEQIIHNTLKQKSAYESANKQLESLSFHPEFGLITGPERPLNNKNGIIELYSKDSLIHELSLSDPVYGSLVALTTLPDGSLLALERVFINIFAGLKFTLHLLKYDKNRFTQSALLTVDASSGLFNDNFEGLTHHKENFFFMISDDNENALQRMLIVYFRLNHPELENIISP